MRRAKSGFAYKTKTQRENAGAGGTSAREFLDEKIAETAAILGGTAAVTKERPSTLDDLFDLFVEKHCATLDPATKRKLETQLKQARAEFGDRHPDSLNRLELEDWRTTLSPGSRSDVFRAFRQALAWGVARDLCARDASAGIKNAKRKQHERKPILPFENWAEIDAVGEELDERYRAIPVFATGTGMRPEEWIALERADVDRQAGLVHVCKRFSGGELKQGTKTVPERFVPLRSRVVAALDAMPTRIDTKILFPAPPRGGYLDLEKFRHREWAPALRAAGIAARGPYTMRHSFATWAIEDGIQLSYLAKIMGTSVRELEDTYFRWMRRSDDALRNAFDAYDAKNTASG